MSGQRSESFPVNSQISKYFRFCGPLVFLATIQFPLCKFKGSQRQYANEWVWLSQLKLYLQKWSVGQDLACKFQFASFFKPANFRKKNFEMRENAQGMKEISTVIGSIYKGYKKIPCWGRASLPDMISWHLLQTSYTNKSSCLSLCLLLNFFCTKNCFVPEFHGSPVVGTLSFLWRAWVSSLVPEPRSFRLHSMAKKKKKKIVPINLKIQMKETYHGKYTTFYKLLKMKQKIYRITS